MSDPLSVAGTIAGLVGVAIQLSQVSYQYVASIKGSSKAWSSYIQELSALTAVLLRLQAAAEVPERGSTLTIREPHVSADAVNECVSELQQVKTKLDAKLARGGIMGKFEALAWPFSEMDTQKKVDMLHRFHSLFSSALLADNFTVSVASYREIREQRQENDIDRVLERYRPLYSPQQAGIVSEQRCPGTGSAFLLREDYLTWRNGPKNCLWAYGQPGVGKTVLSAAILEDLKSSAPKGTIVLYHFFRADSREDTLTDLLRHLVFQSLNQCVGMIPEAANLRKTRATSSIDPLPKDLIAILTATCKACPAMYVVLDGLDECQYLTKFGPHLSTLRQSDIKIIITSRDLPDLRKLLQEYTEIEVRLDREDIICYVDWRLCEEGEVEYDLLDGNLKEAIASRLFEHVDGSFLLVRLLMDHISSLTTIKKIRRCLETLPSDYQEAYQRTFDRILKQNSGRRELALKALTWVSSAKRPLTMRELQYAVAAEDSDDTVGDEDLESPKSILSSCLGLVRLSRTEQKVEFIHSSARSFTQARVDPDADKTITRACLRYMSTVELASGPSLSFEDFTRRLQSLPFLEYAARFYGYHARSVEQSILTELRRILEDEKLRGSSWQVLQFIYGPHHIFGQEIFASLPCRVSVLHVASFWGFSHLLATVLEDNRSLPTHYLADIDVRDSQGWTPLHWAASMGHTDSATVLLCSGAAVDSLDFTQWTPLFWAAIKGHREIVDLLLSRGANIHQVDSDGMTPAHWSISAGQDATAHLLLKTIERGGVRKPNRIYTLRYLDNRECLSISEAKRMVAPYTTSKSIVQLSADSLDATGFSKVIQSVERKAEQAKFYYALGGKDVTSIEPLFRTLWRVKNKSDWGFWLRRREDDPMATFRAKLLERAIEGEHVSLVKALLDLDEDSRQDVAGVVTYSGDNYLHRACTRRNPEIALALLAKGADVNQPDKTGRTPLHHACMRGSIDVVTALLGVGGINVQPKTNNQQTPLITLLCEGGWRTEHRPGENLAICKVLIERGASIYHVDENGNTTANIAIRLWDSEVIELLLNLGVSFSNTKANGMTPLHLAASAPFDVSIGDRYWDRGIYDEAEKYQIPSSAIEKSLDLIMGFADSTALSLVDSNSGCYEETALSLAIASKNWIVARRLHDLGARFKTNRPLYPLLVEATWAGIPELMQLLIQNGAEVNPPQTKPEAGKTPGDKVLICEATRLAKGGDREEDSEGGWDPATPNYLASGNYLAAIQVLISAGIKANAVDNSGMNALEYAAAGAVSTQILRALLDAGLNPYAPGRKGFDHIRLALLNGIPNNMLCLWQYSKAHPAPASHWLYQFHSTTDLDEQDNLIHMFVIALRQACIIDARDEDEHTLLFNAAMGGNQALAQELILSGADVNCADPLGWTPLHAAISQQNVGMTVLILKAGADIGGTLTDTISWNADRGDRWLSKGLKHLHLKAIHLALTAPSRFWPSKPQSPELVRLLLNNGADPRENALIGFDYNGKMLTTTPIKQLFEQSYRWTDANYFEKTLEIAEMIVQGGAVVGDVALELTVEHVALFDGHEELWKTLQNGMKDLKERDDND